MIILIIIVLFVTYVVVTSEGYPKPSWEVGAIHASFACPEGQTIDAYFKDKKVSLLINELVADKIFQSHFFQLDQTISADGGRYEKNGLVFWTKGDGAFVQKDGTTTIDNCIVKK